MNATNDLKCFQIYDFFKEHVEQLGDVEFLTQFLTPHCRFRQIGLRGSRLCVRQTPSEFARFLVFMAAQEIDSYLEIGTSAGGSWFIVDSYLRATNPKYARSLGCDCSDKLRDWSEYKARFPSAHFSRVNSQNLVLDQAFGMSFIDATHTEAWVRHDFNKVKAMSRFVAFHDIVLPWRSTVNKFWASMKNEYMSWEIIDDMLPQTCGIGIVQLQS